jgi:hypothetical protein
MTEEIKSFLENSDVISDTGPMTIADQQKMFEAVAEDYLNWGIDIGEDKEEARRVLTNFVDFAKARLCVEFH